MSDPQRFWIKRCDNCGAENHPVNVHCRECGTDLPRVKVESKTKPPPADRPVSRVASAAAQTSKRNMRAVGTLIVFLLVVAALWPAINRTLDKLIPPVKVADAPKSAPKVSSAPARPIAPTAEQRAESARKNAEYMIKLEAADAQKSLEQLLASGPDWDQAVRLASSTPRVALVRPIELLLAVRRRVSDVQADGCAGPAKVAMLSYMDSRIEEFHAFMRSDTAAANAATERASAGMASTKATIDACVRQINDATKPGR